MKESVPLDQDSRDEAALGDSAPETNTPSVDRGNRVTRLLHRLNGNRFERLVPEEYREIAERQGVPLPNRFVPSMHGRAVHFQPAEK